jgi:hypothetical protein
VVLWWYKENNTSSATDRELELFTSLGFIDLFGSPQQMSFFQEIKMSLPFLHKFFTYLVALKNTGL